MKSNRSGLIDLPTELLYEIQLYALSDSLPHVSRHIYRVFKFAPDSFHAEYILGRLLDDKPDHIITRALRYPLCTTGVIDALCRLTDNPSLQKDVPELPKRLFRDLPNRGSDWTEHDHPLPFPKHLFHHPAIRTLEFLNTSCALKKAVDACNLPLISFFLDHYGLQEKTALLWASAFGHEGVVRLLLAQDDIDVNETDQFNRTSLSWAAWFGNETVVRLLLARDDIDVNAKDNDHCTPLRQAVDRGHEGVVRLLLARDDIDTNLTDTNHWILGWEARWAPVQDDTWICI